MNKILETVKTPQESVNDDSVVIVQIYVKNGDKIEKNQILAEIETSKANIDIHSQEGGFVKCLCEENQDVLIGETLFEIYSKKIEIKEISIVNKDVSENNSVVDEKVLTVINTKFSKGAERLILENKIEKNVFKNFEFVSINEVNDFLQPEKSKSTTKINNEKELITIDQDSILNSEKLSDIR